jgi:hypothetical protein
VGNCLGFEGIDSVPGERSADGGQQVCVVKLDASFEPQWVRVFGGALDDLGQAVTWDSNGDIIVAGQFRSILYYGGTGVGPSQSQGDPDGFMVKLDGDTGAPVWATSFGGAGVEAPLSLGVDTRTGNIGMLLLTAAAFKTTNFGPETFTNHSPRTFLARYDADGNYVQAALGGSNNSEMPIAVRPLPTGGFMFHGGQGSGNGAAFGLPGTLPSHYVVRLQ